MNCSGIPESSPPCPFGGIFLPFFQLFSLFSVKKGGFPARTRACPQSLTELFTLYTLTVKGLQGNFSKKRQYMKEVFIKEGQNTVAKRLRDIPRAVEIIEEINANLP